MTKQHDTALVEVIKIENQSRQNIFYEISIEQATHPTASYCSVESDCTRYPHNSYIDSTAHVRIVFTTVPYKVGLLNVYVIEKKSFSFGKGFLKI